MQNHKTTAVAHPNIAFIKYWGIKDFELTLPVNGSISMNLAGLESKTTVEFKPDLKADSLILNGKSISGTGLLRAVKILDRVRKLAGSKMSANIVSNNNFPTGSGIASSASGFAALALAASASVGLNLDSGDLSRLARISSGSASRSIPGGFVEWFKGTDHHTSFSRSFAPVDHWKIADCVAIVSQEHKPIGSLSGHAFANNSPLQATRIEDSKRRLDICRQAILNKDFNAFAEIMELDSNIMHAVMMSSTPNLFYWDPPTIEIMKSVQKWRNDGLALSYTIDAGPNVHVICKQKDIKIVKKKLEDIPGVIEVLTALPGGPARLIE